MWKRRERLWSTGRFAQKLGNKEEMRIRSLQLSNPVCSEILGSLNNIGIVLHTASAFLRPYKSHRANSVMSSLLSCPRLGSKMEVPFSARITPGLRDFFGIETYLKKIKPF